ncbi:MAG: aminotransferase class V-fold PLP-dependent enzyme [Nitrospirae bacterium]|nr:aminotransferase class V-fold PLP-dependent enzyme [Nitrospirota bacterium]
MKRVYLDNGNTTPLHPDALSAMLPFLSEHFGNPASIHAFGEEPRAAMNKAREQVAGLIGGDKDGIIFTSCGTESNNNAVKGVAAATKKKGNHIIASAIEHFSVLYSCKYLEKQGYEVTYLPVDGDGLVNPDDVKAAIKKETVLVTVMHANGEMGAIQPVTEIGKITREAGVAFHVDAVASAGNIPIDAEAMNIDLLSLAGNMFYGPKGAAALYVRKGTRVMPIFDGGVQEGGRRAGTENLAGIVGMGKAAELAVAEMPERTPRVTAMRDRLVAGLRDKIQYARYNGHPTKRLPGNLSISMEYIEGESMLLFLNMQGVAASSGSACTSRALKASHVLTSMGVPVEVTHGSLLMTVGRDNTDEEIDYVLEILPPIVQRLRDMSPLYEDMVVKKKG